MRQLICRGLALGSLVIAALCVSASPASAGGYRLEHLKDCRIKTDCRENDDSKKCHSVPTGDCKTVLKRFECREGDDDKRTRKDCDEKRLCQPICKPICRPEHCHRPPPCHGGETPEPTSLLLVGLGGLGAITRLRRRAR